MEAGSREQFGVDPGDSDFLRQSVWQFPYESGDFGELGSIDVLGNQKYSWLHSREHFSQKKASFIWEVPAKAYSGTALNVLDHEKELQVYQERQ